MPRESPIGSMSLRPNWCVSRSNYRGCRRGPAIRAAKNATNTIPIVMRAPDRPRWAGLVESLARPGGNVTGFSTLSRELGGKRLELLKETVPKLARVAVLDDPAIPGNVLISEIGSPVQRVRYS